MKLIPIAAAMAALTIATVAVAQTTPTPPANKADCEKAKMKWDEGGKDGKGVCVAATPAAPEPKK